MNKPHSCTHEGCDKAFTTRFSLRRHLVSHLPAKQFQCKLCFKKFTLGQYLREHMYIHTGQKPYVCKYPGCGKSFRQAGKLSQHKK